MRVLSELFESYISFLNDEATSVSISFVLFICSTLKAICIDL